MSKPKISTADKKAIERVLMDNRFWELVDEMSMLVNTIIGYDPDRKKWAVRKGADLQRHDTFAKAWKEFTK